VVVILGILGCGGSEGGSSSADAGAADAGIDSDGGLIDVSRQPCLIERRLVSDQTVLHRSRRSYDEKGRILVQIIELGWDYWEEDFDIAQRDQAGNPIANEVMRRDLFYSYDPDGRLSLLQWDNGGDGSIEFSRYSFFDPTTGLLDHSLEDGNIGDGIEATTRYEYSYDGSGKLMMQEGIAVASGVVNNRWAFAYDTSGRVASVERNNLPNTNACVDAREKRTYDDAGRLVLIELDGHRLYNDCTIQADDIVDLAINYDYDDEGRVFQVRFDTGADGSIERREERSYDCN